MFKTFSLTVICILMSAVVSAQSVTIKGLLLDSLTQFPISYGTITNGTKKISVLSNNNGFFRLDAAPKDFIYAYAKSYKYDTLNYSFIFTDTITIFLAPAGTILPNVTVRSSFNKYQLDSTERRTEFEQNKGKEMKALSTSHPSGFGVTINLDQWKKNNKVKKQDEQMFNDRERMAYVDYRFSPQIVAYYTGLKGEPLRSFMHQYTPPYSWLRSHPTNEDVLYYLNDKLKTYKGSIH